MKRVALLVVFSLCLLCIGFGWRSVAAQDVQAVTVLIDASTTQPVGTGLVPDSSRMAIALIAEGALRLPGIHLDRYTEGWFGPCGEVRFARAGQPVTDGMPWGCLLETFYGGLTGAQYAGEQGVINVYTADVGNEFSLGVNMSDADLALTEGAYVVHAVMIPDGVALSAVVRIDASTGQPVGTGLVPTDAQDRFIIHPYGLMRIFAGPDPYSEGWFGPEGKIDLQRSGMPLSDGVYGSVTGTFTGSLPGGFYAGDGGAWRTQTADIGDELELGVNMSDADLASIEGTFEVVVILIPAPSSRVPEGSPNSTPEILGQSYPNPMSPSATIRYSLAKADHVYLRIYDTSGRVVCTLVNEMRPAGSHAISWDGRDNSGGEIGSGTYFYQISTSQGTQTHRLVLTR